MQQNLIKLLYLRPYSEKTYGAEEQDLEAGLEILSSIKNVCVYDIRIDLKCPRLIHSRFNLKSETRIDFSDVVKFFYNKFSTFDHAMTQAYTYKNYCDLIKLIKELEIDIIMTNTTSTVLFGNQKYAKHIFRSVCFEPIYVLRAVNSKSKALLHSVLKLLSIKNELKAHVIFCISPRDARFYKNISKYYKRVNLQLMPLRQLKNHSSKSILIRDVQNLSVGFLGSTYNVLHNRKSLEFVASSIPNEFWFENGVKLNIYGRKIPSDFRLTQGIHVHEWVEDINEIYNINSCFIVPYFLGSGMQSKVFEPLIRGRILICDTRVLSEYPFMPYEHYIPAETAEDFVNAIKWVKSNPIEAIEISKQASTLANYLMGKEYIIQETLKSLRDS